MVATGWDRNVLRLGVVVTGWDRNVLRLGVVATSEIPVDLHFGAPPPE